MRNLRMPCAVAALLFLCSYPGHAEEDESPDVFVDNYRFALAYTSDDGRKIDVEFVVSANNFKVSTFEPRIDFSGTILRVEKRSLVLRYDLRLQKQVIPEDIEGQPQPPFAQIVPGGLNSNIRLELGSPVEILKVGPESARLTVTRVE